MQRALVLAHEPESTSALVGRRLSERGFEVHEHIVTADESRPDDAAPFPEIGGYDVLVVMGSIRSLTNTDEIASWIFDEIEMVRTAHRGGTPVLGVCFGGQLLAKALGGVVETAPEPEIGWYEIAPADGAGPEADAENGGGSAAAARRGNPVGSGPWFQWHHDRFTPPPEAELLAVTDNGAQLFRVGRSVGMQFHPEVTYEHLANFLRGASDEYLASQGLIRSAMLAEMAAHADGNAVQCAALVDWFLEGDC